MRGRRSRHRRASDRRPGDAAGAAHSLRGTRRPGYRLGYGGGFYDRTLGAQTVRPVTVGIAFDVARIASIAAQPHDVRLDLAITESGVL